MHWPQITMIILMAFSLLYNLAHDGEKKTGTYNLSHDMLATGITVWLLWAGGFFG